MNLVLYRETKTKPFLQIQNHKYAKKKKKIMLINEILKINAPKEIPMLISLQISKIPFPSNTNDNALGKLRTTSKAKNIIRNKDN